jgi:hypothetical protein
MKTKPRRIHLDSIPHEYNGKTYFLYNGLKELRNWAGDSIRDEITPGDTAIPSSNGWASRVAGGYSGYAVHHLGDHLDSGWDYTSRLAKMFSLWNDRPFQINELMMLSISITSR